MPYQPFTDEAYPEQLEQKKHYIATLFSDLNIGEPEVYTSPPNGYRMRAEFKLWHEGEVASYAMYRKGEYKKPYTVTDFVQGSARIQSLMPRLLEAINQNQRLRKKLFQVEFLTTLSNEALVTLIYHKKLDEDWEHEARALSHRLNAKIMGRSRKQKIILDTDFVTEKLSVGGGEYRYQQIESSFTQPNALVCEKMLDWAQRNTREMGGDLLELYCGNGNFTLPLAKNFRKVLATELAKSSVYSATYNMDLNGIDNISLARMSSEEFSQALDKEREFFRLRHVDLDSYDFTTIFVDPPRAGMDPHTVSVTQRFDNIVYISCNPETLKRDLTTICETHRIEKLALFDQFPFTDHIECGAILKKR